MAGSMPWYIRQIFATSQHFARNFNHS